MNDLPNWVYDLVIELEEQRDEHPTLYFTSGAFEGYQRYDWCSCALLDKVPAEVAHQARVIREYVRSVTPGPSDPAVGLPNPRADTEPASGDLAQTSTKAGSDS